MADPIPPLVPEDIDPDELEELAPTEDTVIEEQSQEPDRLEQLKEYGKEKFQEAKEQRREAKEQEKLRTDESRKPPQQPEPPAENPELTQHKQEKIQSEAERAKNAKQKLEKATGDTGKTVGKEVGGAAEKEAAAAARQGVKAGAKAAGQAAKVEAQALAQGTRALIAGTSEIWGPVLIVLLIVIALVAVAMIFFSFSKNTGKGPAQYPEGPYDQSQIVSLLAVSSDSSATREKVLNEVNKMEERLNGLKTEAGKKYTATKAKTAQADIDALIEQINLLKPVADDPVQRKVVIDKLNTALENFTDKYPELIFSAGNCADLKPFIDEGKFSISRLPERATIAAGYLVRGGHSSVPRSEQGSTKINPKLCNLILFTLKNGFDIGGVTLTYGHRKFSSATSVSQHYVGEAIDIAVLNGASVGSAKWKSQANSLMQLLQKNYQGLGIWELWGPNSFSVNDCKQTSQTIGGHDNHVHIGVVNPSTEGRCR